MWIALSVSNGNIVKEALDKLYAYSIYNKGCLDKKFFFLRKAKNLEEDIRKAKNEGKPIVFGGDHTTTYSILKALGPQTVVQFDAHLDLCNEENGKKFTHATWARRALEEKLIKKLIVVGVRDCAKQELVFAKAKNVKFYAADECSSSKVEKELSKIKDAYVTIDMDVLDPSIAPNVKVPVPCGLSIPTLLNLLRSIKNPVGADVVEILSKKVDSTAISAAYVIREWLTAME